jgi:outer membrane protein TolC
MDVRLDLERRKSMGRNKWLACAGISVLFVMAGCQADGSARPFEKFRNNARGEYVETVSDALPAAGDELPAEPTLDDYVAYAALHNAGLEAAFNRWKAALEKIPQAKSLPDPQFNYRYYISEVETRVGAMRQGAGVSQMFPWIEKLLVRGDAAAAAAQTARQRFRKERWQLARRVADAYWELYYLDRSIAVVGENMRLVEHLESVARTMYKTAAASHPDFLSAQVELGKLEDRLRSLQDLRGPAAAELNGALNRPVAANVPPPSPAEQAAVAVDDEQLLAWLAESNPQLAAMDAEVERRRREVRLARLAYVPDLMLGVDYTELNDSTGGRHPSDDGKDAVVLMASINLPIWVDRINAGIREARFRHYAAMLDRHQTAADLAAGLKRAAYDYRDAERKLTLYRDMLLPKARQLVKTDEAAFRGGTATFLDLVDAQRVLLEFDLAATRARADRDKSLARIEAFLARPLAAETQLSH